MKVTTRDILAILQKFAVAGDDAIVKQIDQVKQLHPSPINQLVTFRYRQQHFFMLVDETAEDNVSYIMQQIRIVKSDVSGELLKNPVAHLSTFGMPYKGKDIYLFCAVKNKTRLDLLLAADHPEFSRSTWQKYIKQGLVYINGKPATRARQEVDQYDNVTYRIPEADDHNRMTLPILYLDDEVIVVNKPAGMLTHSKGVLNDEFTIADFFRRYTKVGLETNRPGIVHRLDRDTSGVIIGARTPEAFAWLKKQFAQRLAQKVYLAVVQGAPTQPVAHIDIPIGRNPAAPSTFRPDPRGRSAQTLYKTLAQANGKSLLALKPRTGRTHQLRVHLRYIDAPIVGDRVYGKAGQRMFLHAYRLSIATAVGKNKTFVAPVPAEFRDEFPGIDDVIADI